MNTFSWTVDKPVSIKVFIVLEIILITLPILVFNTYDSIAGILIFLISIPAILFVSYKIVLKRREKETTASYGFEEDGISSIEPIKSERASNLPILIAMIVIGILCIWFVPYIWSSIGEGFRH
jgi:hypothetical protein